MDYRIRSEISPLIIEGENDKKIILFTEAIVVKDKDSKFNCICNFVCTVILRISRFIGKYFFILKDK